MVVSGATSFGSTTTGSGQQQVANDVTSLNGSRAGARSYYIDELGFYRYVSDFDKQRPPIESYSNLSFRNNSRPLRIEPSTKVSNVKQNHFDRNVNYDSWKDDWDEFMRIRLTSRQPVTLNRELKNRVRSGIPHDYRCKVWSAIIRMRTRAIRAQFGDDIYQTIIEDFVSKVPIPIYSAESQSSSNETDSLNDTERNDGAEFDNNNNTSDIPPVNPPNAKNRVLNNGSSYLGPLSRDGSPQYIIETKSIKPTKFAPISEQRVINQEPMIEKCFKQIELDLLRTLPNNCHFEDPNSRGIKRVRRVLRAYACFNQSVGYCQGMNRLAAMALLVLPEEEAFWCLVAIIQCIMPKDYYLKPWLAQVDCCVLSDLLEKKMPKLHKHLAQNDIQLTLFTWFFTIFVDGFRPELMLRIWDCFLLEGDKVLFRFALSILYISQEELLRMNDFSTMSTHLSRLVSSKELDIEHLFDTFNEMNPFSTARLQSRREIHRNKMQSMIEEY